LGDKKALLLGAVVHVGNGEVIQNSAIGISNGYFQFVKNQLIYRVNRSEYDTVINLNGYHLYPGFIVCNSTLGLTEIDAVRATRDFREVGRYNANVRAITSYNTDSRITPTVRYNGVLIGQIVPRGGSLSGTSAVVHFDAWNWEDALIKEDGVHLNWPNPVKPQKESKQPTYQERRQELYQYFEKALSYAQDSGATNTMDVTLEALKELFSGKKQLYIHADLAKALIDAVKFKRHFKIPKMVVVGGYDAWLIPEVLTDEDIPVILKRTHSLPKRPTDPIDLPYSMPAKLKAAGVEFTFDMSGDMEAMNARNLPFTAGTAVKYGLKHEEAITAITLSAAKILGIDDLYGTVETGKSATFFATREDPLDMRTNHITMAMVNGKFIALTSPQLELYEKFKAKYQQR